MNIEIVKIQVVVVKEKQVDLISVGKAVIDYMDIANTILTFANKTIDTAENNILKINGCTLASNADDRTIHLESVGLTHSGYVSGRFYSLPGINATTFLITTKGRMYAHPIVIKKKVAISQLAISVVNGGVASTFKAAIYDASGVNGNPNVRLAQGTTEAATDSSSSDAVVTLDANVTLYPGIYWLVTMYNWVTTAPIVSTFNTIWSAADLRGAITARGAIFNPTALGGGYVYADNSYASNFPANFGTATDIVGNGGALVAFKAA